jgi:hypothetical protein
LIITHPLQYCNWVELVNTETGRKRALTVHIPLGDQTDVKVTCEVQDTRDWKALLTENLVEDGNRKKGIFRLK